MPVRDAPSGLHIFPKAARSGSFERVFPASSNGRTEDFDSSYESSNLSAGTLILREVTGFPYLVVPESLFKKAPSELPALLSTAQLG